MPAPRRSMAVCSHYHRLPRASPAWTNGPSMPAWRSSRDLLAYVHGSEDERNHDDDNQQQDHRGRGSRRILQDADVLEQRRHDRRRTAAAHDLDDEEIAHDDRQHE